MVKEVVDAALVLNISGLQSHEWRDKVPPGWVVKFDQFYKAITILGGTIAKIEYMKGTLRVTLVEDLSNPQHDVLLWIVEQFAKVTSQQDLVDPLHTGVRRKEQDGWPPLSEIHYIIYVNELEGDYINDLQVK